MTMTWPRTGTMTPSSAGTSRRAQALVACTTTGVATLPRSVRTVKPRPARATSVTAVRVWMRAPRRSACCAMATTRRAGQSCPAVVRRTPPRKLRLRVRAAQVAASHRSTATPSEVRLAAVSSTWASSASVRASDTLPVTRSSHSTPCSATKPRTASAHRWENSQIARARVCP